jgi:hypothetical protein
VPRSTFPVDQEQRTQNSHGSSDTENEAIADRKTVPCLSTKSLVAQRRVTYRDSWSRMLCQLLLCSRPSICPRLHHHSCTRRPQLGPSNWVALLVGTRLDGLVRSSLGRLKPEPVAKDLAKKLIEFLAPTRCPRQVKVHNHIKFDKKSADVLDPMQAHRHLAGENSQVNCVIEFEHRTSPPSVTGKSHPGLGKHVAPLKGAEMATVSHCQPISSRLGWKMREVG